jgi:hypothetical protein
MDVIPKETSLWKSAFADCHCTTQSQKKRLDTLLDELQKLEEHIEQLLTKIPEDCKGLTIHDITLCINFGTSLPYSAGLNTPLILLRVSSSARHF